MICRDFAICSLVHFDVAKDAFRLQYVFILLMHYFIMPLVDLKNVQNFDSFIGNRFSLEERNYYDFFSISVQ